MQHLSKWVTGLRKLHFCCIDESPSWVTRSDKTDYVPKLRCAWQSSSVARICINAPIGEGKLGHLPPPGQKYYEIRLKGRSFVQIVKLFSLRMQCVFTIMMMFYCVSLVARQSVLDMSNQFLYKSKIRLNQNIINDIFKGHRLGNSMIVTRRKKLKTTKITFHHLHIYDCDNINSMTTSPMNNLIHDSETTKHIIVIIILKLRQVGTALLYIKGRGGPRTRISLTLTFGENFKGAEVKNRSIFTAPNVVDRHKKKKTHIIVKSIHSSLRSESKKHTSLLLKF
ncbi:hypothetical protein AGLY_006736 [Aphis glycines]|uniref:Uncharacterized protein n=1 Tax=Aphis glycines TaxID=307491 RepID=A0A6G0TQA8_APHGL|nr:hypothetical protein AGLY_006736 [Aphis glycines]